MKELIEHGDAGVAVVKVGDQPGEAYAPLKLYQQIYRQITGRPEQISRDYSNNLLIDFAAIQQLDYKMKQLCGVHRVVGWNEMVSVFHEKDRKEQFTSFDAFRNYNSNTSSACVSVVLKYYFSIVPANSERPEEYEVEVRLSSRVAAIKQMKEEAPPFFGIQYYAYAAAEVALIKVKYADYVVARGFMEAFDEWVSGCNAVPKKRWLVWAQRRSEALPWIGKVAGALIVGIYGLRAIPGMIGPAVTPQIWARFIVIYVVGLYLATMLLGAAGFILEVSLDRYGELSYLKLNKGDEKLIDEFHRHNSGVVWRFIGGSVLAVALGIVSAKLSALI
jgi:hypothetical protein